MSEIYDIYDMRFVPFWCRQSFKIGMMIMGIALVLASMLGLVYAYLCYKKRIKLPAHERALRRLTAPHLYSLIEVGHSDHVYSLLIKILKDYLSERYQVSLDSKTEQEIEKILQRTTFPPLLLDQVRYVFAGAVSARFAKQEIASAQMQKDLDTSIHIVQQTTMQENNADGTPNKVE